MDPLTIVLIIGAVIVAVALIWAAVSIIALFVTRKTMRDINQDFDQQRNKYTRYRRREE